MVSTKYNQSISFVPMSGQIWRKSEHQKGIENNLSRVYKLYQINVLVMLTHGNANIAILNSYHRNVCYKQFQELFEELPKK